MRKRILILAFSISCLCFIVSLYLLLNALKEKRKQEELMSELQQVVHEKDRIAITKQPVNSEITSVPQDSQVTDTIVDGLKELKAKNEDLVGWIRIDDTGIDYPVMQSEQQDYYLSHDFDGNPSKYGVPYINDNCNIEDADNIVIHGHHMKDGSMFATLLEYQNPEYLLNHPYIEFSTFYGTLKFKVIAVCQLQFDDMNEDTFFYNLFVKAKDEQDFIRYIDTVKQNSLYDTGYTATYGNRLLTLSTCDQSISEGRFIVVAKEVK